MVIHPETLFVSKGFDVFPSSHEKLFGSHETYYSENGQGSGTKQKTH